MARKSKASEKRGKGFERKHGTGAEKPLVRKGMTRRMTRRMRRTTKTPVHEEPSDEKGTNYSRACPLPHTPSQLSLLRL
jgi:hypothetical protein